MYMIIFFPVEIPIFSFKYITNRKYVNFWLSTLMFIFLAL